MDLPAPKEKLLKLLIDYVQFPKYLPHQIKSVEIIEKTDAYTITEETLHFSTVISKTFKQQTKHYAYSNNVLKSQILSGPAKNSIIDITIDEKVIMLKAYLIEHLWIMQDYFRSINKKQMIKIEHTSYKIALNNISYQIGVKIDSTKLDDCIDTAVSNNDLLILYYS